MTQLPKVRLEWRRDKGAPEPPGLDLTSPKPSDVWTNALKFCQQLLGVLVGTLAGFGVFGHPHMSRYNGICGCRLFCQAYSTCSSTATGRFALQIGKLENGHVTDLTVPEHHAITVVQFQLLYPKADENAKKAFDGLPPWLKPKLPKS